MTFHFIANKMECETRGWEEMIPDALGLIFQKLPLQEILTVIPRVCKSWERAVSGPYCWQYINIKEWSQCNPQHVDRMLQMLITRSSGSLRKLCVSNLSNDPIFSFIANNACSLQTLELPRSEISDSVVEQVAARFSNITFLDLSYCVKIGATALAAFGKHCKCLVELKRRVNLIDVLDKDCQDDEAQAIACTMPKLKSLEVPYLRLTTKGVSTIVSSCKDLEYLDIRGCWDVELDEKFLEEEFPHLKVVGPPMYWDSDNASAFMSWDMTDESEDDFMYDEFENYEQNSDGEYVWTGEQDLEPLEVRFYGGGFSEEHSRIWPPSSW